MLPAFFTQTVFNTCFRRGTGREIAVYSVRIGGREKKKRKLFGTYQEGMRGDIHRASAENRMMLQKQNDVIHHVGTGIFLYFATVTIKTFSDHRSSEHIFMAMYLSKVF